MISLWICAVAAKTSQLTRISCARYANKLKQSRKYDGYDDFIAEILFRHVQGAVSFPAL